MPDISSAIGGARESTDADADIFRPRFEAAFDEHHAHVLAFALRRVAGMATAEDVVSETFAIVWQKRDLIPEEPLPWIYAIARRVIANQLRSENRRGRLRDRIFAADGAEKRRHGRDARGAHGGRPRPS